MGSSLVFKTLSLLLHGSAFILGSVAIELVIFFRKRTDYGSQSPQTAALFRPGRGRRSIAPYILTSLRRFGTLIFGLTCLGAIGFVATLCSLDGPEAASREFTEGLWKLDAVMCTVLVFLVIPVGLSYKYINIRTSLDAKVGRTAVFLAVWVGLGTLCGHLILRNMFFMMTTKQLGAARRAVYYMCGFGLFFVAALVGFSGIYLPYLLYVINRDVSTVRQLENLIADCNKARKELRMKMLDHNLSFSDDESTDDEFDLSIDPGSPASSWDRPKGDQLLTAYAPAEMCMNLDVGSLDRTHAEGSKLGSFFSRLRAVKLQVASRLYSVKYARNFGAFGGPEEARREAGFSMWLMLNDLKNDLDYLKMLKREKEASSRLWGKARLAVKCVVAAGCMVNCFKICKRAGLMLASGYGEALPRIDNQKILTGVYYEFMRDEIVSSILNEVLEKVKLPTAFDFLVSRANLIFLACVMISSVGYFLDFGLVLLKTKYLQRNKLLSDTSLGLALACFMILTFPSQFLLVVPFLPKELKANLLGFLFDGDIFVWFGMRYRFDLTVLWTVVVTFAAVVCLHASRASAKGGYQVGCNV